MRTNTLSITQNLQVDTKSNRFSIKKHFLCLCLLGALVIAGFSAPNAEASCEGCSNEACQKKATDDYLWKTAVCVALDDPLVFVGCMHLALTQYKSDQDNCDTNCPPCIP